VNTGVEIDSNRSLEMYVGTLITVDETPWINEVVFVEVADSDKFLFKYTK